MKKKKKAMVSKKKSMAKKKKDYKRGGKKMSQEVREGKMSDKIGKVMDEFKNKKLHSGSKKGPLVKNKKQAMAISLSEARKAVGKKGKRK